MSNSHKGTKTNFIRPYKKYEIDVKLKGSRLMI